MPPVRPTGRDVQPASRTATAPTGSVGEKTVSGTRANAAGRPANGAGATHPAGITSSPVATWNPRPGPRVGRGNR
ncbi:hypothetical protein ADK64_15535 [Streptomyces sp. MMG1121]|nr:hypothetical protein ADK64_15535 [Streptomyces sp. MMG1121]